MIGSRESDWRPLLTADIVVDDLDTGFSVRSAKPQEEVRVRVGPFGGASVAVDMDQGLPEFKVMFGSAKVWSRSVYADSWGKYRHTHALVSSGPDDQHAVFTAELPHQGRWRLSYHLALTPEKKPRKGDDNQRDAGAAGGSRVLLTASLLGEYQMTLISNGESWQIEFDGQAAASGWNDLGEFQLSAGEAKLEISNANTGTVVIADAIRWRPAT